MAGGLNVPGGLNAGGRRGLKPPPIIAPVYNSILGTNGASALRAPASFDWAGIRANSSNGATDNDGMDYAVRKSSQGQKLRFELRNTTQDRRNADLPDTRRRDEVAFNYLLMQRNIEYWMAVDIQPTAYADPTSMLTTAVLSGLCLQFKGDEVDGTNAAKSANIGFRRCNDDDFAISTVGGEDQSQGVTRYKGPWTKGVPHRFVVRAVLDDVNGELDVWMDGSQLFPTLIGIPTAPTPFGAGTFIKLGAYNSGGLGAGAGSSVINEMANLILPQTTRLTQLITNPFAWPTD